jgi:DNA-binding response OmpR family regulator
MPTRVLTVEDDTRIRTSLRMALEEEGYAVSEAESAEEALTLFHQAPVEVVLIDVLLPGMNGFDLCREIRAHSDVPIVMITARSDTHDVVAGLEAGADDYVVKPFVVKELAARLRSLLRRAHRAETESDRLVFGDVQISPEEGVVTVAGRTAPLTKTEFRLLVELAQHSGKVLSREQLLERIWGYEYLGDGRLVDAHIRRLRTKIEPDPSNPRHVLTVRGLGYKLGP